MANESNEILTAISNLRVPQHAIDINVKAAERLATQLKSQYNKIVEIKPLEGENPEQFIKGQTILIEMAVMTYLSAVKLQGEAEIIRINDMRSRDPANTLPLIDSNAERAMADQFANAVRALKTRIEVSYLQRT